MPPRLTTILGNVNVNDIAHVEHISRHGAYDSLAWTIQPGNPAWTYVYEKVRFFEGELLDLYDGFVLTNED